MSVLLGSEVAAQVIWEEVSTLPEVTSAVESRLFGMSVVPASAPLPAGRFYPVASSYPDGPISGPASVETLSIVVAFTCKGTSTGPIRSAVEAQYTALAGKTFERVIDGATYVLDFTEEAEAIPTTEYEAGEYRRTLGTRYRVNVTRG